MTTNYHKGRRFEYRVRDLYRKHGWYVLRSAGSKTVTDLVAIGTNGTVHFIQCKADGKISVEELIELVSTALHYSSIPVVAVRHGRKLKLFLPRPSSPIELNPDQTQVTLVDHVDEARKALAELQELARSGRKYLRF